MQTLAQQTSAPAPLAGIDMPVEEMTAERLKTAFTSEGAVIVRGLLGVDMRVDIEYSDAIPRTASGQYRFTICELDEG